MNPVYDADWGINRAHAERFVAKAAKHWCFLPREEEPRVVWFSLNRQAAPVSMMQPHGEFKNELAVRLKQFTAIAGGDELVPPR